LERRIGIMKHVDDPMFGFLGKRSSSGKTYQSYTDFNFKKCSTIRQCYLQEFTLYGRKIDQRMIGDGTQATQMPSMDTFQCGSFGYMKPGSSSTCVLDMGVASLYRAFCYRQTQRITIINACPTFIGAGNNNEQTFRQLFCEPFAQTLGTCNNKEYRFTKLDYSPDGFIPEWSAGDEATREGIPCLLNRLSSAVFAASVQDFSSSSADEFTSAYLEAMKCSQTIFNAMISIPDGVPVYAENTYAGKSLYHFSQYGMYEYPFSWLVKCVLLAGRKPADTYVPCPEWEESFDPVDAVAYGAQRGEEALGTWDFLTRVRGGILLDETNTQTSLLLTNSRQRWIDMVNSAFSSQGSLFQYRECANSRSVIPDFFSESKGMQADMSKEQTKPSWTGRWPLLNGDYQNNGGRIICTGLSPCKSSGGVCGCTQVTSLQTETSGVTLTPSMLVKEYLLSGTTVGRNSFLGKGNTLNADMKLPLFKYSSITMDAKSRYILMDHTPLVQLVIGQYPNFQVRTIFTAPSILNVQSDMVCEQDKDIAGNCQLVDTREAQYDASRSCIFDTADGDAFIEEAENNFPGGRAALLESRARPPYLIIAMGTDVQSRDWLNDEDAVAQCWYDNTCGSVDSAYYIPGCKTGEDCASKSPKRPNLGAMILLLNKNKLVNLNLFEDGGEVDSFCGLTNRAPLRKDACGPINGPYLFGCTQPGTKILDQWDYNRRHTCIHDHSCSLTLMSSSDQPVKIWVNGQTYWKPVSAPGWDLIRHPNASKAWPALFWEKKLINDQWWYNTRSILSTPNSDAVTVIPPDTLPFNELWRHHSDTRYLSKFYLPIGVFLEAFNARQGSSYRLDDPSYDPGKPSTSLGMWPMCPHDDATFGTDHNDQLKSNFLPSASTVDYGSQAKRYQVCTAPSNTQTFHWSRVSIGRIRTVVPKGVFYLVRFNAQ
jgi:hypothetical protein